MTDPYEILELGDVPLQCGVTLRGAKLAYKTYGMLSPARDNAVLMPTFFGAQHTDLAALIGPGRALDPEKYFIVVPNLFGNGLSSSPSNTPPPLDRAAFPPICGSARTSPHNWLFLEGVKAALTADAAFNDGWYESPPVKGLRACSRVYAGWYLSQDFFREQEYRKLGLASLEDTMRFTEDYFRRRDANNLLAMLSTWQHADISANDVFHGDFEAALGAIRCRTIVLPCTTDLYFRVRDNELEVQQMPDAELRPIPSIWGHLAVLNPVDSAFIDRALNELLAS